jgi:hypothetical protein
MLVISTHWHEGSKFIDTHYEGGVMVLYDLLKTPTVGVVDDGF